MARAAQKPALRPFLPADAPALAAIFRDAVEELAIEDYDAAQIDAWASRADDGEFARRLSGGLTLVASLDGRLAGFATLRGRDEIDMLYVAGDCARRGVATTLCDALETLAAARGAGQIVTDASDTARPFFAQRGYEAQMRNTQEIAGQWLGNTTMKKQLASPGKSA